MAAVLVGQVPEAHAMVHAGHEEVGQALLSEPARLVGAAAHAARARALGQARDPQAGAAQGHDVLGLLGPVRRVEAVGETTQPEEGRARPERAVPNEVPAMHRVLPDAPAET